MYNIKWLLQLTYLHACEKSSAANLTYQADETKSREWDDMK